MAPSRRLEDRIRELLTRLDRVDDAEVKLLSEIRAAMNDQAQRFRKKTRSTLLLWRESPRERRKP